MTITQSHTHTMQQTHTHKAVTGRVEAKKLLSRRRQSEYSCVAYDGISKVHGLQHQQIFGELGGIFSGVTAGGGGVGDTSHWEISANLPGKERHRKRENGEEKREN